MNVKTMTLQTGKPYLILTLVQLSLSKCHIQKILGLTVHDILTVPNI